MICAPVPTQNGSGPLPTIASLVTEAGVDGTSNDDAVQTTLALVEAKSTHIEHLLTCPVCLERYTASRLVPKLLPCHHSFCVLCLESLQSEKDQYHCPTCRKTFERPSTGKMMDLQTNFYVVAILESRSSQRDSSTDSASQQQTQSSNVDDVVNGVGCRLHNKPLTFFCSSCSLFICNQCILEHNKKANHSIEDLDHYIDNCKVTLTDRSAVAVAAQEARQQYVKTLKSELEASATRQKELSANFDQLFRSLFVKLNEVRRKIEDEITTNCSRIDNRLTAEIAKMESEAERLETVGKLCDDVRGRNDLKTLSSVFSSADLLDVVNNLSQPIQTLPRVAVSSSDQPIREMYENVLKFIEIDQTSSILTCSEVKRPVIVLPQPTMTHLQSPIKEGDSSVASTSSKLPEQSNSNTDSRDSLSPIAESNQRHQLPTAEQLPTQGQDGVIEIDNVPVKLRDKPARRVASSHHVDELCRYRSQVFDGATENLEIRQRELNHAKQRYCRRSLVELRMNHPSPSAVQHKRTVGGETAMECQQKSTPTVALRHQQQVLSYHPQAPEVIVPQHQSIQHPQHPLKSSSSYVVGTNHAAATITSNSSSGASSGDGSGSSDALKMSPPNAGGQLILGLNSAQNAKTPFIFEFDDADSTGSDDGIGGSRRRNNRRHSSTPKLHSKILAGMAPSPSKQVKDKNGKKFSLGRAISELFGKNRPAVEVGRRGEEKVTIRAVPIAASASCNSSGGGGTVTSSDSGGDHHSLASAGGLGDPRSTTPSQLRCASLESMALMPLSVPSSKSGSSGQQSVSPRPPYTALAQGQVVSPGVRQTAKVIELSSAADHRRFSGDFTKRMHLHIPSKIKVTGGPKAKTRSYYVSRDDKQQQPPVIFPAQKHQQMVTAKPPPFNVAASAAPGKSKPSLNKATAPEGAEIVNALLVASSATSSHIQFNNTPNAVLSKQSSTSACPSFCQSPVLRFGRQGAAPGAFDWPESIALASGGSELYVGDFKNHRIEAFTSNGDYLYEFSVKDGMIDYYPGHMAFDPRGDRLVFPWLEKEGTGYIAHSLVSFTRDGRYLSKICHRDFGCPRAVAINSRSEMFVADQQKGCIFVFDRDGRRIRTIGKRGTSAPGEFNHPCHVALGRNQEIIVADQNNNRIQVFDTRGGICEVVNHRFTRPCYCAVDAYGSLLVADGSNKISILSLNSSLPSRSPIVGVVESAEDRLRGPRGLAVDSRGSLWVCDVGNFCIKKYDYSDLLQLRL